MAACFGDDTELSEQNVINCGQKYGAGGCDGGDPAQVFDYSKANGVATETAYPYANRNNEFVSHNYNFNEMKRYG